MFRVLHITLTLKKFHIKTQLYHLYNVPNLNTISKCLVIKSKCDFNWLVNKLELQTDKNSPI